MNHDAGNAYNESAFIDAIKNSGAQVLAYIHGHVHGDNIVTASTPLTIEDVTTYPYADIDFPMISISCQKVFGTSSTDRIGNFSQYGTRDVNSYGGYCFDTIIVHADTGHLDFYRFGAGNPNDTFPTRSV